jgi:hypothetical protein
MSSAKKDEDPQYIGDQPTKQKPGEDPDEADPQPRDEDGNFISKGRATKGVQPLEDDDIPEAGR